MRTLLRTGAAAFLCRRVEEARRRGACRRGCGSPRAKDWTNVVAAISARGRVAAWADLGEVRVRSVVGEGVGEQEGPALEPPGPRARRLV
jgi:hypothetical protein